jgi:hypothetical protein
MNDQIPQPLDSRVGKLLDNRLWKRLWVVTGGQTGADRAAMDFALQYNLPMRGWCPKGRASEAGAIEGKYPLQETGFDDPAVRTEMNVIDSDATLVLTVGKPTDGTPLTERCARTYDRPLLTLDLSAEPGSSAVQEFRAWIEDNSIRILNIAGPRESHAPGQVYAGTLRWLEALLLVDSAR